MGVIEKSIHKSDSRKEVEESEEKCQTDSEGGTKDNAEKALKRAKRQKSAARRISKKTSLCQSKSEPVEELPHDDHDQSEVRRQVEWAPNIVQEGWKEVVERVARQRQEQEILDERKRKADEIKAETQKKEEKLRQDLEAAQMAEEKEKEERRALELAE